MELKFQNNSRTYPHAYVPQLPPLLPLRAPSSGSSLSSAGEEGLVAGAGLRRAPLDAKRRPKSLGKGCVVLLKDEDVSVEFISFIMSDLKGITMKTNYTFTPPPPKKEKEHMDDSVVTGWGGPEGVEIEEGIWKINGDGKK